MSNSLPPNNQRLCDEGLKLRDELIKLVEKWPTTRLFPRRRLLKEDDDQNYKQIIEEKLDEVRRWFNILGLQILPSSLYAKDTIVKTRDDIEFIFMLPSGSINEAKSTIAGLMNRTLSLIKSVPLSLNTTAFSETFQQTKYTLNTAFILMWMNPIDPELDDICNAIKEVCSSIGIKAFRADDVEHQDRITDVTLQHIANSEFLIADLTGERPNVYYEVGYAHALNKHPILYRRQGTKLHFDLSVHNVPEYRNITELKTLLNKRFEAILEQKLRSA